MKHIDVPIHYNIEDNLTKKQNDDVIFLFEQTLIQFCHFNLRIVNKWLINPMNHTECFDITMYCMK